jgi:hypothetical protein
MFDPDSSTRDALTELAHALIIARPIARSLRTDLADQIRAAGTLEAAIDRAIAALLVARGQGVRS